jgi:hypothetical protein
MVIGLLIDGTPAAMPRKVGLVVSVDVAPHDIVGYNEEGDGLFCEINEYPKCEGRRNRRPRATVTYARLPSAFGASLNAKANRA